MNDKIEKLMNDLADCFKLAKKINFSTINLNIVAIFELQLKINKELEMNPSADSLIMKLVGERLKKEKDEGTISSFAFNSTKTGYVIIPDEGRPINTNDYVLYILRNDNEPKIA